MKTEQLKQLEQSVINKDEIEKVILDWFKSENENTTYLAHLINSKLKALSLPKQAVSDEEIKQFALSQMSDYDDDVNHQNTYHDGIILGAEFALSRQSEQKEDDEPYFGWCDVEGCEEEGCSGGNAWRKTGYWTVCTKHSDDNRAGKPQPEMKQKAIDRENSRDKETGYLTTPPNKGE